MTSFTMVNILSGRRDRYVGFDPEELLVRQALRWLTRANWFPIGNHEFYVKMEHLGPTWANFLLFWNRDKLATRCFVCLDQEVSKLTWDMAEKEQAWIGNVKRQKPPSAPWLAIVLPEPTIPLGLYPHCVSIERALMSAIMKTMMKGEGDDAASTPGSGQAHGEVLPP